MGTDGIGTRRTTPLPAELRARQGRTREEGAGMNLLTETTQDIERTGHSVADVIYIGSRDGYSCTWDEFVTLADRDYDNGYGGQEVASDLEIHFRDGGWLERSEYDGSEDWTYRAPFVIPTETKPIERVMRDDVHWDAYAGLAGLHEDDA